MSPALVGQAGIGLALAFSICGLLLALWGHSENARRAGRLAGLATLLAFGALEWALLSDDFSLAYVAEHHSSQSPTWVKFATLWAALAGSILLWALLQTGATALAPRFIREKSLLAPALAILFTIQIFFLAVVGLVTNPFTLVANPPFEGPGPNPLLQNHWMMAVHPVLMYIGFVGLSIPFAVAGAALLQHRPQDWLAHAREPALFALAFLSLAIFAGGWWSYEVLGWGGYWAWDPVENASFIPWILTIAFLHTLQVNQSRGLFRGLGFALILGAYATTILGTFITRSGVIASVHAFAEGPVGPLFLGFFLLVLVFGLAAWLRGTTQIKEQGQIRLVSRESILITGSGFLLLVALVVLFGTLFPLIAQIANMREVSVGAPYYNQTTAPLFAVILLLMGLGPLLPWRQAGTDLARRAGVLGAGFLIGAGGGLIAGLVWPVAFTLGLFVYNLAAIGLVLAPLAQQGWPALKSAPRKVGSATVHLGIAITAIAIVASQSYRTDIERSLAPGSSWQVAGVTLTPGRADLIDEGYRQSQVLTVQTDQGPLYPAMRYYPNMAQPVATPAVQRGVWRDFYLVLHAVDPQQEWVTLRVVVMPLVSWIWVGGILIALGSVYALAPLRRQGQAGAREVQLG